MNDPKNWLANTFVHTLASHGLNLLVIFLVSMLAYYAGNKIVGAAVHKAVKGARHRTWHRKDIEKRQNTLTNLFRSIWKIIVTTVFLYATLNEFFPHLSTTLAPLFASAGIIGVALGFGAQSLIKDFLSGIFIISENQYRVGDVIDIDGASGTVERIGTRSTVLRDYEGNVHYFPNGMVQHVINKTMGYSMARFTLLVHPMTDIDELTELVDKVGIQLSEEEGWKDKIIEAPALVAIGDITGSSTEVIIAGKTQPSDQWAVTAEMRRRLLEAFEDNHVKLAVIPKLSQLR